LQRQVDRLHFRLDNLERISNRYSWARLAVFGAGVVTSGLVFFLGGARFFWIPLAVALVIFSVLLHFHYRVERSITRHRIWRDIKRGHIARMGLDWASLAPATCEPEHPLEVDLDLAGPYSLHRLVSTAVSDGGRRRLRDWLVQPIDGRQQILRRQQLVRELVPLPLFRDRLTLNGTLLESPGKSWDSDRLLAWLDSHALSPSLARWLVALAVLAAINVVSFILDMTGIAPPIWQGTLVLYVFLSLWKSRGIGEPFREAAYLRDAVEQLLAVFRQLETFNFQKTPSLAALCRPFLDRAERPSHLLVRLSRIVNATGIRGNPLFWLVLNLVFPWDLYFAYRLNESKQALAALLPGWLAVWFDLEALSSLANLAYLNPAYTFPEILEEAAGSELPIFQAQKLGHPLLRDQERVNNSFTIDGPGSIDIITGSNMSGKSTFLRTVGTNLAMAYAGGPVSARFMRTAPFRLFTCIRISDSVTDGVSYFYAEVKCLKALLEELARDHRLPLFYFIDEIFRGTNNRERLIGSRAYIRSLAGKHGVGLIATHDLELVNLAEEVPGVRNYHFTDAVVDGRMVFDYTLHPGPSPTTNALKIMRMEGLPVFEV